ncbi:MAG: hypothetical protein JWM58_2515 [Rhizobium sp.]|nr:hypothetical protein [Rhizobium sp.]
MKSLKRPLTSSTDVRSLSLRRARQMWLDAQGLTRRLSTGSGPKAVAKVVKHLGYVQIDTINVVERCHHHILFSRLPSYQRSDLNRAQSDSKSVFEYWTHALAYIATEDYRFYMPAMERHGASPHASFAKVSDGETQRLLERIDREGPISIRDIDDDVLVEKDHAWASRKPSRRVLSKAFYSGELTVASRSGMLKTYDITTRHFGWKGAPEPAPEDEVNAYMLDRALNSQAVVSLDSVCYLEARRKPAIRSLMERRVAEGQLVPVSLRGDKTEHWATPGALEKRASRTEPQAKILSPFDPLIIQRKRLELFFGYTHRFEAYVPAEARVLGYFALPVLYDQRIVAAIDIKADRRERKLLINKWTRYGEDSAEQQQAIEEALHSFQTFQFDL